LLPYIKRKFRERGVKNKKLKDERVLSGAQEIEQGNRFSDPLLYN